MNIAICEDNSVEMKTLRTYLEGSLHWKQHFSISTFDRAEKLLLHIKENAQVFDMIFFDIIMDGINGFEAATQIRSLNKQTIIVFITSDTSYVYSGYEINAFRYLLKPVNSQCINNILGEAISQINSLYSHMTLSIGDRFVRISTNNILYVESMLHKIYVHTTTEIIQYYGKLSAEEGKYFAKGFARCHRSYLVNMSQIKAIEKNEIILMNGARLPLSRQKRAEFMKNFTVYMGD